jgi:hypothetical protein
VATVVGCRGFASPLISSPVLSSLALGTCSLRGLTGIPAGQALSPVTLRRRRRGRRRGVGLLTRASALALEDVAAVEEASGPLPPQPAR